MTLHRPPVVSFDRWKPEGDQSSTVCREGRPMFWGFQHAIGVPENFGGRGDFGPPLLDPPYRFREPGQSNPGGSRWHFWWQLGLDNPCDLVRRCAE